MCDLRHFSVVSLSLFSLPPRSFDRPGLVMARPPPLGRLYALEVVGHILVSSDHIDRSFLLSRRSITALSFSLSLNLTHTRKSTTRNNVLGRRRKEER
jgi:hypothetical protein